ncbi:MAG: hypothetical protein ABJG68_01620 [Crocinitomicaceae bacterium]
MAHAINTKSGATYTATKTERKSKDSTISAALGSDKIEYNRFGISAIVLLFVVCFSGVTVGVGGMDSALEVGIIVAPTMAVLTTVIAVQPMKYVLGFAAISVLVNLVICILNLTMGASIFV